MNIDAEFAVSLEAALSAAHSRAAFAFREMLEARSYGDPNHPRTKAYVASERVVDELLVAAQGEAAFAAMDALVEDLAAGDHFRYADGVGG